MNKTSFKTEEVRLQKLYDEAENRILGNIRDFGGRKVLVEGAGYEKIWLETQPMGGEMFFKRDNSGAAINNILLFMEMQRSDGRLPGSIALRTKDGTLFPEFNKMQGFFFAEPALNMYYLLGEDREYLNFLGYVLERFDRWLWSERDSDGDGCLESFCVYDTGEDCAVRYKDAPNYWTVCEAPTDYYAVPMASSDVMGWSFSARNVISRICKIQGKEDKYIEWQIKAREVRQKTEEYLWDKDRGAFFDRYKNHKMQSTLTHATLKAMYWGNVSKEKADIFVNRHLLNEKEFGTYMPIPAVSVSDPDFRNITENNWSGQCEALIWQRAIRAFENYSLEHLIPYIGKKVFTAVGPDMAFVQQFDPFTGKPSVNSSSGGQPTYGPAILSVLEYIERMYGIHREGDRLFFGLTDGPDYEYIQVLNDTEYRICHRGNGFTGLVDGKTVFDTAESGRMTTDLSGHDPVRKNRNVL